MKELITINNLGSGNQTVSARDLHGYLGATERFSSWIQRMFEYGFVENEDYTGCKVFNALAKQELQDFALTLDTAKEISMLQRTEKGRKVRRYFIDSEKKLRQIETKGMLLDEIVTTKLLTASSQLSEYDHLNFIGEYDEYDSTVHIKRFVHLFVNEWTRIGFVPSELINQQYKLYCKKRGISQPFNYYRMSLTIINYCPKILVKCSLSKELAMKGMRFSLIHKPMS